MNVTKCSWADLGYSRLTPAGQAIQDWTRKVARALRVHCEYDVQESESEIWIRDKAKQKGHTFRPLLKIAATLDSSNYRNKDNYDFAERYRDSLSAQHWCKSGRTYEWTERLAWADKSSVESEYRAINELNKAISLGDPDLFGTFLRQFALPKFFERHPGGKAVVLEQDMLYMKRFVAIRGGYTMQHYPDTSMDQLNDDVFPTLKEWQDFTCESQARRVLDLVGSVFYPQIKFAVIGPMGLSIVLVPDKIVTHEAPLFPSSWPHWFQSRHDFAEQEKDIRGLQDPNSSEVWGHRRHCCREQFAQQDILRLIEWIIERYNEFGYHLTETGEFLDSTASCLDLIFAREFGLTADRIFRRAVSCVWSPEAVERKMAAMEIADMMEALRTRWDQSARNGAWFKTLFNPEQGCPKVKAALGKLPLPFSTHLSSVCSETYSELLDATRASVWHKEKVGGSGPIVKSKDLKSESEEGWPAFTANLMRALRNTHHGHLTSSDPSQRPSRYLVLSTGNVPDSLSYLGVLWTLAMLADPAAIIGWHWLPVGKWD